MAESTESKQLRIFITGAGQGAGLACAILAARAGHYVVGATDLGSTGTYRLRRAGVLAVYPELTRESAMYSAIQMAKADVIINAAPQVVNGIPQQAIDYDSMLPWLEASTDALLLAAGRADIDRIIHLSAGSIYGDTHHEAVKEDGHLDLSNALGKALYEAEESVFDGGIPVYVLRTGYVIGTHQSGIAMAQAIQEGKGVLSGKQHTAWAHEDDIASAALAIAEKESDEATETVYNIASMDTASPDEFMAKFGAAIGTGEPSALSGFMAQFRTSELQRKLVASGTLLDTSKAQTELGWSPSGSIEGAIDRMLLTRRIEEAEITVYHQAEENTTETGIVKA